MNVERSSDVIPLAEADATSDLWMFCDAAGVPLAPVPASVIRYRQRELQALEQPSLLDDEEIRAAWRVKLAEELRYLMDYAQRYPGGAP